MAEKSRDAFRTISEVADWLDVPTHVLRFWESRFSQIKPVKRAGGRRYYRPSDMRVIGGVKVLLHDQGMTIRGVQKLFREEGIKHVSGYAPRLFGADEDAEKPHLNEEALAKAAIPAAPARSTYDAAPDPDPAPPAETLDESEADDAPAPVAEPQAEDTPAEAPVLFRRSRQEPEVEAPVAAEEVPEAPAPPSIPETPNVPDVDPADDADNYARAPGAAARLKLAPEATLLAHKALLAAAAERLRAMANRAD